MSAGDCIGVLRQRCFGLSFVFAGTELQADGAVSCSSVLLLLAGKELEERVLVILPLSGHSLLGWCSGPVLVGGV